MNGYLYNVPSISALRHHWLLTLHAHCYHTYDDWSVCLFALTHKFDYFVLRGYTKYGLNKTYQKINIYLSQNTLNLLFMTHNDYSVVTRRSTAYKTETNEIVFFMSKRRQKLHLIALLKTEIDVCYTYSVFILHRRNNVLPVERIICVFCTGQ